MGRRHPFDKLAYDAGGPGYAAMARQRSQGALGSSSPTDVMGTGRSMTQLRQGAANYANLPMPPDPGPRPTPSVGGSSPSAVAIQQAAEARFKANREADRQHVLRMFGRDPNPSPGPTSPLRTAAEKFQPQSMAATAPGPRDSVIPPGGLPSTAGAATATPGVTSTAGSWGPPTSPAAGTGQALASTNGTWGSPSTPAVAGTSGSWGQTSQPAAGTAGSWGAPGQSSPFSLPPDALMPVATRPRTPDPFEQAFLRPLTADSAQVGPFGKAGADTRLSAFKAPHGSRAPVGETQVRVVRPMSHTRGRPSFSARGLAPAKYRAAEVKESSDARALAAIPILAALGLGGAVGAYRAPRKRKAEGAARGASRAGTVTGGTLAGAVLGGLSGPGLASRVKGGPADPNLWTGLGAAGGALGGGVISDAVWRAVHGRPSWEASR